MAQQPTNSAIATFFIWNLYFLKYAEKNIAHLRFAKTCQLNTLPRLHTRNTRSPRPHPRSPHTRIPRHTRLRSRHRNSRAAAVLARHS